MSFVDPMVQPMCFAVRRGGLRRLDPKFIINGGHQLLAGVATEAIGSLLVRDADYGAPFRAIAREANEVKYIRVTDFDDFGIPDDHEFVTAERIEERYLLADGDVLFARSGATAGKTFLYRSELGPSLFAGYCIRFRFDAARVLPEYVYFYTKTARYSSWVQSMQRPAGQPNINKEEFKSFTLPVPTLPEQRRLVRELEAARQSRREKLKQADTLLAEIDELVLNELGIKLAEIQGNWTAYAIQAAELYGVQTLNPSYFHPERISAIRAIQARWKEKRALSLGQVVDFVRNQRLVQAGDDYLGLANVQPNTGERVASTEKDGTGNCFEYSEDDVLFARLRPYLNKVYRAEHAGVCSTEFHVMRIRRAASGSLMLIPDYLAAVMRSSLVLAQTRHMMTGNTHPRLSNDDVVNLLIPIPDWDTQNLVAEAVAERRLQARHLRQEAERVWEQSKLRFEDELLRLTKGS